MTSYHTITNDFYNQMSPIMATKPYMIGECLDSCAP